MGLIQLCSRKIHRAIARSRSGIWLVKAPLGGGVECACLLAFAYSDHNRSLIVFANELDNYELVKLLILNTRVHWNYRVILSLVFLLLVTMASKSTASPKRSTVDETPQTFRGSGGRFSKASPGNKNAKSQAMEDKNTKSWEEIGALFTDFETIQLRSWIQRWKY